MAAGQSTIEVAIKLVIDEKTRDALIALGWTPPGQNYCQDSSLLAWGAHLLAQDDRTTGDQP